MKLMREPFKKLDGKDKTASFPYLVLAVSLIVTVIVTYNFYQGAKTREGIRFNGEVSRLQSAVENKINLYIALLKGARGFIESNRTISRRSFAEYVGSLEMDKNYTSGEGIGYARVVPFDGRESFVEQMKREGDANFNIFPADRRDSSQIVAFLEPSDEHSRKFIGFDLASDADQRAALQRAADSGEAVTSSKINFGADKNIEENPGFTMYLPIYKGGGLPATVEARRANISGFIYIPFRADRFLGEIQSSESAADIAVKIYDGDTNAENLLMQTADRRTQSVVKQSDGDYAAQRELDVTGKKWIIQFNSSVLFAAQSSVGWTPYISMLGAVLSFLLFGMTYWETFARIKLQATAGELFDLQEQKQELLEKERDARMSSDRANKTKDEFIAVVSHELRTPLNAIAGWSRILKSAELSDKTKNMALEKIERNLRLQTKLVEQLLDYSQIISGIIKLEDEEFSLSKAFENIYSEVAPTAREKRIEIVKDNRLNGQRVLGDESKFKVVIYNLLNNAVKFTDAGGKIEAAVTEDDGTLTLIIKDNGIGIHPDFMPYIFDRFTQADSSTTRGAGGLGLGLTISDHIIKMHGGKINATSDGEGKGSVFTVNVPRVSAAPVEKTPPNQQSSISDKTAASAD